MFAHGGALSSGADRPGGGLEAPGAGWAERSAEMPLAERVLEVGERSVPLWWLGTHGGAGESTLADLISNTAPADHVWPVRPDGQPTAVVLVARASFWGVRSLQAAVRQWAHSYRGRVDLLGSVVIDGRPGGFGRRAPAWFADALEVTPCVWRLPWVEAWELGELPAEANAPGRAVDELTAGVSAALEITRTRRGQ